MTNAIDYSKYKCPFSHIKKEYGHELCGPEGHENNERIWCTCGFRGPAFYLHPFDLGLEELDPQTQEDKMKLKPGTEIKSKDVNRLIREGRLELGDLMQFRDDGKAWTEPRVFAGAVPGGDGEDGGHFIDKCDISWDQARVPVPDMPELRKGDPVIVITNQGESLRRHFAGWSDDGKCIVYALGLSPWTYPGPKQLKEYDDILIPTPSQLEYGGYPRDYYERRQK